MMINSSFFISYYYVLNRFYQVQNNIHHLFSSFLNYMLLSIEPNHFLLFFLRSHASSLTLFFFVPLFWLVALNHFDLIYYDRIFIVSDLSTIVKQTKRIRDGNPSRDATPESYSGTARAELGFPTNIK